MNKFIVHHSSSHHADNSGYARLIDYIDAKVIYGIPRFPFRFWKYVADLHSQKAGIYDAGGMLKTLILYEHLQRHRHQKNIVHFLNGERDIRHLGFLKRKFPNTFFCATFHKPPAILKESITDVSALKKLDGAIAVGANQVEFLKEWLNLDKVTYIPHGVDTDFYKPNEAIKEKNMLLFVGQHLRDFGTFNNTIPKVAERIVNLQVKVVIHPAYISKIVPHPNVEILTKINDLELLNLYQRATILYLPLLDSTACNTILESMACGLPIITSKVGGNLGYLDGTMNIFVDLRDNENFVQQTIELLNNERQMKTIGNSSRIKAEHLNWRNTLSEIDKFYISL